ncbi:hypothetical protein JTB14_025966 [Gonioctena quinquepunctata]|nr:hypothetical protein JTB14_025966 [Gonioctena quinquepunctata]
MQPDDDKLEKTVWPWQAKPQNVNCVLTKSTFCPLLREVLDDKSLPQTIKNGFRKCGLFLFVLGAVDYSKCVQKHLENLNNTAYQEFVVTEDQFNITEVVLYSMRDKLFEKGVENISNVIVQLKKIKEEYFLKSTRKTPTESNNSIALPLETPPHDFMVFDFEEFMHDDFPNANAPNNNEVASKIIVLEDIVVLPAKSDKELVIMPLVQNLETIIEIDENAMKKTDIQRVELTEIKHIDYNIEEELNEIMNDKETEQTEDEQEEVISEIQCEQSDYSDSIVEVNRTTETSGNISSIYKILVPAMTHNSGDCDEMIENSEIELRKSIIETKSIKWNRVILFIMERT